MCIRDRAYLSYAPTLWDTTFHTAVAQAELEAREYPGAYHPVSYTHLRAHETVLDIVCRLLLEKKKTHKYYQLQTIPSTDKA